MGWRICLLMIVAGALRLGAGGSRAPLARDARIGATRIRDHRCFHHCPSHRLGAVKDFLDIHPEHPVQPIAYTHTVHLAKGLPCTFCHVGVDQGPEARIPGVNVCMSCHSVDRHRPARDQEDRRLQGARRRDPLGARLQLQRIGARALQSRAAHSRRSRLRLLPRRSDQADHG